MVEIENSFKSAISNANAGHFDGDNIVQNDSVVCLYIDNPYANKKYKAIKSILETTDYTEGTSVKLRYGSPNEGVEEIKTI